MPVGGWKCFANNIHNKICIEAIKSARAESPFHAYRLQKTEATTHSITLSARVLEQCQC